MNELILAGQLPGRTDAGSVLLVALAIVMGGLVFRAISRSRKKKRYLQEISSLAVKIGRRAGRDFLVQPCSRCYESEMRLVKVSPNGRSIQVKCLNCGKSTWAPAGNSAALNVSTLVGRLALAQQRYEDLSKNVIDGIEVRFTVPESALPFQQTRREPIPEAVRSEVWRRDQGRCTKCGSNQNLEFDHMIPVSRGGATSVPNLQLLCRTCNRAKSDRI